MPRQRKWWVHVLAQFSSMFEGMFGSDYYCRSSGVRCWPLPSIAHHQGETTIIFKALFYSADDQKQMRRGWRIVSNVIVSLCTEVEPVV